MAKKKIQTKPTDEFTRQNAYARFRSLTMQLPNPDPVLRKLGQRQESYKELMYFPRVKACQKAIKSRVLQKDWRLNFPKGFPEQLKERFVAYWRDFKIAQNIGEATQLLPYGNKVFALAWERLPRFPNDFIVPRMIGKPIDYFYWDKENKMRFKDSASIDGRLVEPGEAIAFVNESEYENPYGFATLAMCWWSVFFLKEGLRQFARAVERFNMPWVIGRTNTKDPQEKEDFKEDLSLVGQDGVMILTGDTDPDVPIENYVRVINGIENKNTDLHKVFHQVHMDQILIAFFGEAVSTATEGTGTYGGRKVGKDMQEEVADDICPIIAEGLTEINKMIMDVNVPDKNIEPPTVEWYVTDKFDALRWDRDIKINNGILKPLGKTLSEKYLMDWAGYGPGDIIPLVTDEPNDQAGQNKEPKDPDIEE